MTDTNGGGQKPPSFRIVEGVIETREEVASRDVEANIAFNIKRDTPRLHKSPMFGKWKGKPLAIVAGGPSLRTTLSELKQFPGDVMACGTVHDFLVMNWVRLDYCVICDPDPIVTRWLTIPQRRTKYLLSSSVVPALYDLFGPQVLMWHCHGGEMTRFHGETAINGGCTVTLRAICIAIMLGYHDLHFFGFDSSFETEHHAYPHDAETSTRTLVRVGGDDGRVFTTTIGWLAQASQFQEMLGKMGHMFNPTIHGDGLIAEIMRVAGRTYTRPDDQIDGEAFQQSLGKVPEHYKESQNGL